MGQTYPYYEYSAFSLYSGSLHTSIHSASGRIRLSSSGESSTALRASPAAGVAGVDGRVGLDEVHGHAVDVHFTFGRADDAVGDGAAQLSQRVADVMFVRSKLTSG